MGSKTNRILDAHDDFRALFESAPDLMYTHDLNGLLTRVNRAFERATGYSREEAVGSNFFDLIATGERDSARQRIFAQLGGDTAAAFPLTLTTKRGVELQLEVSIELIFHDGQPSGVQGFARDVGQVVTFTRYLQQLHRLNTTNYDHIDTLFDDYLATGCKIFGADSGAITSVDLGTLKTFGTADHDRHAAKVIESRRTVSLGSERPSYLGTPIIIAESVYGVIGFLSDEVPSHRPPHPQAREVIELMAQSIGAALRHRQLTDQLAHQANHDALTDLPNRLMLQRELDLALQSAAQTSQGVAVVFIDLDRFKQINDTLGHEIGDQVLQQIGGRLSACMRPGDTLARMGGDEFTAILTGGLSEEAAADYARELMMAVRAPCPAADRELFVTASVGISLYPKDGLDAATLLRNADAAMYTAKYRSKDDLHFFTADGSAGARMRLDLETHLRRALERNEFEMQFQPQVDLKGRLASLEALLVWDSPDLGRIPPADFIPIAEETGMILPIGTWVLQHACRQMAGWRQAGFSPIPLAVNVSALQFAAPNFVATVADALATAGLPADELELELTESLIMRDVAASVSRMKELREIGVKIAIDDFGTGYSSLSYLRRLPADCVKIDQSFLRESEFGPATLALIKAIAVLAHNIGLRVTAEGVETLDHLELIRRAGCDRAQGHLFGVSLPHSAVEQLLQDPHRLARTVGL